MGISHQLKLFGYSWRAVGPGRMVRNSLRWATDQQARSVDDGFDERFGTDTNAEMTPGEAGLPRERRKEATMYLPTMDYDFDSLFAALGWPPELVARAAFIDLGSGKGRAVLLAAMRGFREVVGVELSPVLHQIAGENVARVRGADVELAPIRLIEGDAATVELPAGPLVVYLYHPFRGNVARQVLEHVIAAVEAEPRPTAILYCHPTLQRAIEPALFESRGVFRVHAEGSRPTRHFEIGWTVLTNRDWLSRSRPRGPARMGRGPA